jgi:translation initiation factor 2 beta subunit (eIF-2beta)/eIF-5
MNKSDRDHSPERKKAEAMFHRAQSALPTAETEQDAHRREAREKITRLKSLRTGKAASERGSGDHSKG